MNSKAYRAELQTEKPRKRPAGGHVYFVRAKTLGFIKIGVAHDVKARLSGLQSSCPDELELVAYYRVENAREIERGLHQRFAAHRLRGEWFHPTPELLAEIEPVRLKLQKRANRDAVVLQRAWNKANPEKAARIRRAKSAETRRQNFETARYEIEMQVAREAGCATREEYIERFLTRKAA